MKQVNDKSIKDRVNNLDRYEVKTTADDVLRAYEAQKAAPVAVKKPLYQNRVAQWGFALAAVTLIVGVTLGIDRLFPITPAPTSSLGSDYVPLKVKGGLRHEVGFQIISSFELLTPSSEAPLPRMGKPKMQAAANDVMTSPINTYDKAANIIDTIYTYGSDVETTFEVGSYVISTTEYKYKIVYQDNKIFYYNGYLEADDDQEGEHETETEFVGVIVDGDAQYTVEGEKEVDGIDNEIDTDIIIKRDADNYLKLQMQKEDGEQEFVYEQIKDGSTDNYLKLKISSDDDDQTRLAIELQVQDWKYLITRYQGYELVYYEGNNRKGFFEVHHENGVRSYKYKS